MKNSILSLRYGLLFATIAGSAIIFQNCSQTSFSAAPASVADSSLGSSSVAICNPLGSSGTSTAAQGLVAHVFYVPQAMQSQVTLNNYTDLQNNSVPLASTVYLPDLDVPTSPWTDGYSDNGAAPLQDDSGNSLLEYFGMTAETQLKLGPNDSEGYYQFATISDDGAFVTTTSNGVTTTLAGSTGNWHASTNECGTSAVQITRANPLPLNIVFYQGPPTQIAMTFLWRYVSNPAQLDTTQCGVTSTKFFATTDGSAPLINSMKANGWNIVPSSNFYLPAKAAVNPCASGTSI